MSTESRFKQARKDWATSADDLADQCYVEFFDVDHDDLYDLEGLVDEVHDRDEGYRVHQILDYGGVDRVVDCGDRHVHIAQRFRPNHRHNRDLSLRTETGIDGRCPELTKWRTARRERGYYPSVLAFGLYDDVLSVFNEFWLLDVEAVLDALTSDEIDGAEHPTGDGTAALYLSLEDLDREGCVLAYWDGVRPHE